MQTLYTSVRGKVSGLFSKKSGKKSEMGNCAQKPTDDEQLGESVEKRPTKGTPRSKMYEFGDEKPQSRQGNGPPEARQVAVAAKPQDEPRPAATNTASRREPEPPIVSGEIDLCANRGPYEEEY
eukprot:TRINITY_DN66574_c0_g1_i1.p2 TRINITY_DN66574_c0_g1~~TRINITY_DN66574_c0_g1_i1.p2  ORF type:complete len:124 (+),score=22.24 TRINITY_DN66574_c0_g1_i1:40-411(+)